MITLRKKIRGYFFMTVLNLWSNLNYKFNTINEKKKKPGNQAKYLVLPPRAGKYADKTGEESLWFRYLKKGLEHVFSQSQNSVKQDRNMSKMNMILGKQLILFEYPHIKARKTVPRLRLSCRYQTVLTLY